QQEESELDPADQQHYTTGISKPVENISAVRTGTHPKRTLNLIIRGGRAMSQIRNLDNKRVLDLSDDGRMAVILKGGCITIITVNPDGTLHITNETNKPKD
ncbi:MAG: hypothetical protein IJQ02_14570, partial [Oscillospiraceae bacterium]|nr:hypothetical protein [Oscillospiraceae bacterium]